MGCTGYSGQTVRFGKLAKILTRKMIIKSVFGGKTSGKLQETRSTFDGFLNLSMTVILGIETRS